MLNAAKFSIKKSKNFFANSNSVKEKTPITKSEGLIIRRRGLSDRSSILWDVEFKSHNVLPPQWSS